MKRSEINRAYRDALACFARTGWVLPPQPRWDVTDFGLGDFDRHGLTLVNLAEEPEYCEKLMYARRGQETPSHYHGVKKEDIVCRYGELTLRLWAAGPSPAAGPVLVKVDGSEARLRGGEDLLLKAGSRATLRPGTWHLFQPASEECVIGEVSTANNDAGDNFFLNPAVGRFPRIDEDEPALVRLING